MSIDLALPRTVLEQLNRDELAAVLRGEQVPGKVCFVTTMPACDFCAGIAGRDGTPGPYDFATKHRPWAHGCEAHWLEHRATPALGLGWGQYWLTRGTETNQQPAPAAA